MSKIKIFFKKGIDKQMVLWYNMYVKKKERYLR